MGNEVDPGDDTYPFFQLMQQDKENLTFRGRCYGPLFAKKTLK